jgi:hypothetical protein
MKNDDNRDRKWGAHVRGSMAADTARCPEVTQKQKLVKKNPHLKRSNESEKIGNVHGTLSNPAQSTAEARSR